MVFPLASLAIGFSCPPPVSAGFKPLAGIFFFLPDADPLPCRPPFAFLFLIHIPFPVIGSSSAEGVCCSVVSFFFFEQFFASQCLRGVVAFSEANDVHSKQSLVQFGFRDGPLDSVSFFCSVPWLHYSISTPVRFGIL